MNIIKFIKSLENIYKEKCILNISRGYKMKTEQYTSEQIRELYGKTSTDPYRARENKEWLSDEQQENWRRAYLNLSRIARQAKNCKMETRVLLLAQINSLYEIMCGDIKDDLIEVKE